MFPAKGRGKGHNGAFRPILVWTPGKTGQSAVHDMLVDAGYQNVVGIHSLEAESGQDGVRIDAHLKERKERRNILLPYIEQDSDVKIVIVVRDVMQRNISSLFYNSNYRNKTRDAFIKEFNHSWYLDWFDSQIKKYTGIDVYSHDFDREKGWSIITKDRFSIMILKNESLFGGLKDAAAEWGLDIKKNMKVNVQNNSTYNLFCEKEKFDRDLIEKLYSHRAMTHFYTKQEIEGFRAKWELV